MSKRTTITDNQIENYFYEKRDEFLGIYSLYNDRLTNLSNANIRISRIKDIVMRTNNLSIKPFLIDKIENGLIRIFLMKDKAYTVNFPEFYSEFNENWQKLFLSFLRIANKGDRNEFLRRIGLR